MKITDAASLGNAIRSRRKELKYTQGYISEITGLSVSFISDLENGKLTCEREEKMSEYKIVENQLIVENFVKDVIIKSEFRGKGIGKMLMTYIEDFIKRQIEPSWWTCVELMSAGGKESFYEKLGYEKCPTENRGAGMMKMVGREE